MLQKHRLYDDVLKNTISEIYQHLAFVLGVISNGTLAALILRSKNSEFGAYRYLLFTFAFVDFYYATVHFLIQPIPEACNNVCFMAAHGYITGKLAVSFYASAHSHSFVVLVFHFIYRLLAVKRSRHLNLFSRAWFYGIILICCAVVGLSWFAVLYWLYDSDDYVFEYMKPILRNHTLSSSQKYEEYAISLFWKYGTFNGPRLLPILGILIMCLTMNLAYSVMIYAALEIVRLMKTTVASQSEKTREITKQLVKALIYQTILPLITVYFSPLVTVIVAFFGLRFPYVAHLSPLFCGLHSIIDACMLIYLIRPYRNLLLRWIHYHRFSSTTVATKSATGSVANFSGQNC